MTRILAVSDEVSNLAYHGGFADLKPDLIVACGDLPFDYLEYLVTTISKPLVYVPGNHDPDLTPKRQASTTINFLAYSELDNPGAEGCTNIDGRIVDVAGLRVGGLGGSHRYRKGPNQYTQKEMARRCRRLLLRSRLRRRRSRLVDLLITHSPPRGIGDDDDPCHQGFESFHHMVKAASPKYLVHGHIHPYGLNPADRQIDGTTVVNAVGYRLLEIDS
ncbi:MAG TPA: metallophosphoesterase [Actinomycetota bacterium]|jgi:Icc-related predicted phosphoesterase|nr:metallophosphoesterase [Actinomycetota bacterium]